MQIYACKFQMVVDTKLAGIVQRIEIVCNIVKYIAGKITRHIYLNRNGLLRMLIITLKYNEMFYSLHVKYKILLISHII